jgi:hypothetical protein
MTEEEKGFVIKDRRSFDEEGSLKEEKPEEAVPQKEDKKGDKEEAPLEEPRQTPLPEVNFSSLIISLSSSALLHLGEIADPHTGQKHKDLGMAKHTIDTVALLKEKTKGNLTDEETKIIESVLTDLRWLYVKAAG